mgnify:CR=1 FL=1
MAPLLAAASGGAVLIDDQDITGVSRTPVRLALVRLDEQADIYIPGRLISDMEVHRGLKVRVVTEKITDEVGDLAWTTEGVPL